MTISSPIDQCRICGSDRLLDILDLGDQPPANSLRKDAQETLPFIPLKIVFCEDCSTVQLSETVDPKYLFSHYVWVTGTSATANQYSATFCENAVKRFENQNVAPGFIVEIASNDGTFLKQFQRLGYNTLGVDPAQNIAKIAEENGVQTRASFFNVDVATDILKENGTALSVIARNVIPHVKEVHSILAGIEKLLAPNGTGIIEFHYSASIVDELHYDSIYHEHLFYFSLKTISGLLKQYNLHVFDVEESPISGGSLVIYFSKTAKDKSEALKSRIEQEELKKLNSLETWKTFSAKCKDHAAQLTKLVTSEKAKGKVIGYGASARSSTMLNFCGLSAQEISVVIDKNPLKHDHYTPGSDIKIVDLEGTPDQFSDVQCIILLAWNFADEIEQELRSIGYSGTIISPLPNEPHLR